ncbi:MAG: hypothetical protein IKE03_09635, partial [Blautia sp.]|nr:hypothetical protein [Blautia sp.]
EEAQMNMKVVIKLLVCQSAVFALFAVPAAARTFTTQEDILSIEAPTEDWDVVKDSSSWFEMSDDDSTLTIDHLSRGEDLPDRLLADKDRSTAMQLLISTPNEVFIVNASTTKQDHLQELIDALGSIKVLKYNTKMALETEEDSQKTDASETSESKKNSKKKKDKSKKTKKTKAEKAKAQEAEENQEAEETQEADAQEEIEIYAEEEPVPEEEYLYEETDGVEDAVYDEYYDGEEYYDDGYTYDYDYSYDAGSDYTYDDYIYEDDMYDYE